MAWHDAIYYLLSEDATIQQYVGRKIYPVQIPEGTGFPALTYSSDFRNPTQVKQQVSPLDVISINIVGYFEDFDNGQVVMDRVRALLDETRQTVQGVTIDSIVFQGEQNNEFVAEFKFFAIEQSYQMRLKR
jgi:hypothetical protein